MLRVLTAARAHARTRALSRCARTRQLRASCRLRRATSHPAACLPTGHSVLRHRVPAAQGCFDASAGACQNCKPEYFNNNPVSSVPCSPCKDCQPTEYEHAACQITSDRVCRACHANAVVNEFGTSCDCMLGFGAKSDADGNPMCVACHTGCETCSFDTVSGAETCTRCKNTEDEAYALDASGTCGAACAPIDPIPQCPGGGCPTQKCEAMCPDGAEIATRADGSLGCDACLTCGAGKSVNRVLSSAQSARRIRSRRW